jgi:hypothetical protein
MDYSLKTKEINIDLKKKRKRVLFFRLVAAVVAVQIRMLA